MGRILLSEMVSEVQDHAPSKSSAKIARAANRALREIYRECVLTSRSVLTLLPPYETGTVQVGVDDATVVGTGTSFASGYEGGLIKIEGDETWYPITTVTDPTNIILGQPFQGASNATATYTIVQPYVVLPSTVGTILRMWIAGQHELVQASDELVSDYFGQTKVNTPKWFAVRGYSTDGRRRVEFSYFPDQRYAVTYIYREAATLFDPANLSSVTTLPPDWDDMVTANTLYYVYMQEHKAEDARDWRSVYKDLLSQAKSEALRGFMGQLKEYGRSDIQATYNEVIE